MHSDNRHEELSRQSLVRQAVAINRTGREYFREEARAASAGAARQRYYAAHGDAGKVPLPVAVQHITYLVGLICIYGIDVLLFGVSAQYVASLVGEGDLWAYIAKYAVPAFFLGIEVLISLRIEDAREEEQFSFGSSWTRRFWIAIGILAALVMPLAAKATAESAGIVAGADAPVLMIAVLGIISFAAHVLVLFGGRIAQEAKTFLAFSVVRAIHEFRASRAMRRAAEVLAGLNSLFIAYVHAWRTHNSRYAPMPSGPFDRDVVELLRRQFPHIASGGGEMSYQLGVEEEAS